MAQTKIVYGFHSLMSALDHHPENILSLYAQEKQDKEESARLKAVLEKARQQGITVQPVSRAKMDKLTQSTQHQGVAASVRESAALDEKDLIQWLKTTEKKPLLLILEGIQDPHNLGACLRSAEALGVDWVVIPKDNSAPLSGVVSKVASGAMQTLPILSVTNIVRFIDKIKQEGVWIIGTSGEATMSLAQAPLTRAVAIVMGAEGKGLKRLTLESCDAVVQIPLQGTVESLNVSVATGICLYECVRQRVM